jgi:hypothetical protein
MLKHAETASAAYRQLFTPTNLGVSNDVNELLLYEQFRDLSIIFPRISLSKVDEGFWCVSGDLSFSRTFNGHRIDDEYSVAIIIPTDYPENPPKVRETKDRIPKDFHHYQNDSLCLGAPLGVKMEFQKDPTLVGFVNSCLIPYLYSFSYKQKYGEMPFGELSHGALGILEFYQELFDLKDVKAVMGLINILAEDNYRGHIGCPCGSGKRLRSCHGEILREIKELQPPAAFKNEYNYIIGALVEN